MKKILITSALPYANGPLHFGHLGGAYLPADVTTRHHKMVGNRVIHISGSDEHGVAIMLNAGKAKESYKEYVDKWHSEHKELFKKYEIEFDFFGQTSSEYHAEEVVKWFHELNEKGFIGTKDAEQLFCNDCKNHLPDRFVEGECYECGHKEARGDECPGCGILIDPARLKKPVCKICGSRNIEEVTVTQYYLLLSKYHKEFRAWLETKSSFWKKAIYPFVDSLTKEGLHDRAISRDLDWGIDVPLAEAKGKKLYVWFDAPIGYVSNTKEYLQRSGSSEDYRNDWWNSKDVEIINFIGKDNIIFHGIIFPTMSMATGFVKPVDNLPANQYVNLAGKKFSKSTGHYVDAVKALDDFGSDALRYYMLYLIPESADTSFFWDVFQAKVNNELANNIGNLVNRCLKFWAKNWPEGIEASAFEGFVESEWGVALKKSILEHREILDSIQIRKGIEKVMAIGQEANTFFSDRAPWAEFKESPEKAAITIGQTGLNILVLGVLLSPYLPSLSKKIVSFFGDKVTDEMCSEIYRGNLDALKPLFKSGSFNISGKPKVLVPKIEDEIIKNLQEELK